MKFIPKKYLLLILVFTLLEPLHYYFLINFPLEGRSFIAYDVDESNVITLMRSVEINFNNPWSTSGEKIYDNPAIGSVYSYLPFGLVRWFFSIDPMLMNIVSKALLSFITLVLIYKVLEAYLIDKKKANLAFVLFLIPMGLEFVMFPVSLFSGVEFLGAGFSFEFPFLNSLSRIYYYMPLITGFLSLLAYNKNKKIITSIFLGLTFLFYPTFGLVFALVPLFYEVAKNYKTTIPNCLYTSIKSLLLIYIIAGIFLLPWILNAIQNPDLYKLYKQNSEIFKSHLFSIIGSYFFYFVIIFIAFYDKIIRYKKTLIVGFVLACIISLGELQKLHVPYIENVNIPKIILSISEISMIAFLFSLIVFLVKSKINPLEKFLSIWVITLTAMSIVNPTWVLWMPYRVGYLIKLPLVALGAIFFSKFMYKMESIKVKKIYVIILIGIISISSICIYNYRFQEGLRRTGFNYYSTDDYLAMKFMNGIERGVVLSSPTINYFLPYISLQNVLYHPADSQYFGGGNNIEEKKKDTLLFFSGSISSYKSKEIFNKYNISYVFYGEKEKLLSNNTLNFSYLTQIYSNNTTQIYSVGGFNETS